MWNLGMVQWVIIPNNHRKRDAERLFLSLRVWVLFCNKNKKLTYKNVIDSNLPFPQVCQSALFFFFLFGGGGGGVSGKGHRQISYPESLVPHAPPNPTSPKLMWNRWVKFGFGSTLVFVQFHLWCNLSSIHPSILPSGCSAGCWFGLAQQAT
jgi:hypothetical protein